MARLDQTAGQIVVLVAHTCLHLKMAASAVGMRMVGHYSMAMSLLVAQALSEVAVGVLVILSEIQRVGLMEP